MNNNLYQALFALDAYNRGYAEGIEGLGGVFSQIGNATLSQQSNTQGSSDEVNASFYAVAYSYNGETIISYRGTDDASDIWNGWTTGVGNANSHSARA